MSFPVLVIGASARALAQSVLRSGGLPRACDLFADMDLQWIAPTSRVKREHYPAAFESFLRRHQGVPWIYAGGLENHPSLLARFSEISPLWGNGARAVSRARDPEELGQVLEEAGMETLPIAIDGSGLPKDGSWFIKPLRGTGGIGVMPWRGGDAPPGCYWQRRASGVPHAALFVGCSNGAAPLGVTRQRIGSHFLGANAFQYAGSAGPITLDQVTADAIQTMGDALAIRLGLRGLFGVDFLLDDAGRAWPVEVNPRYTASVEVLELALGVSAIAMHRSVFDVSSPADLSPVAPRSSSRFVDKGILFARQRCRISSTAPCYSIRDEPTLVQFSDIPEPGTEFEAGDPVLSILVFGDSLEQCANEVARVADEFQREHLETPSG